MKLRHRFIVLVAGIGLIPVAVLAFSILLIRFGTQTPLDDLRSLQEWVRSDLDASLAEGGWALAAQRAPDGVVFTVHDLPAAPLAASEAPGADDAKLQTGASLAERLISEASINRDSQLGSLPLTVTGPDGRPYLLIIDLPSPSGITSLLPLLPVIVLEVLLLVFTLVFAISVIRRLQRGLRTLTTSAEAIASGDVHTPIGFAGTDELSLLAESFDAMRARIQESQEQSARFMMGVSHDLKSPLGLISGYADAILDGKAGDEQTLRRFARIIRERADLLETRIESLISLARLETGEWRARLAPHRIQPFLSRLVARYRTDAGLFGHSFHADVALPEDTEIVFDPDLTERALENLFINAFRYSLEGSEVATTAQLEQDVLHLTITNETEEDMSGRVEQLFEPFWRGSPGRNEAGSGLGLAIARSILEAQGWSLYANCGSQNGRNYLSMHASTGVSVRVRKSPAGG